MIDAENNALQPEINLLSNEIMKKYNETHVCVYKTYQMYRKDALSTFIDDLCSPRAHFIGFKLVRGAYLNEDKKFGVLCESYDETNKQYNKAIEIYSKYNKNNDILLCATHNEDSIKHAIRESFRGNHNLEFAQLWEWAIICLIHSQHKVSKHTNTCHMVILKSIPYLLRRLHEKLSYDNEYI